AVFGASWVEVCFRIASQVADALDHAHQRGVMHRNLKPTDIIITPTGRAMVLDFGLASTLPHTSADPRDIAYRSPEQLRDDSASIDQRTDVYALGVMLYEMLTLRPAHFSPDPQLTRKLVLAGATSAPSTYNPSIPHDVETVCLSAMERDAGRR